MGLGAQSLLANSAVAANAAAVTPDDDSNLPTLATKGLWVGGAGNVKVGTVNGNTVTFNSVPAGILLRIQAKRVYATGTTATNIVALW